MKIVILDSYATNPGDLSWDKFFDLGEVVLHERTPHEKIVERAIDADAIIVNKCVIDKEIISKLPKLKYIGELATGFNNIDIEYAKQKGIVVTNVPGYSTDSVAQLTMALILEICHHVGEHSRSVMDGDWIKSSDMTYWNYPLIELKGLTLGIIGYGAIGRRVEEIAKVFGMKVLSNNGSRPKKENVDFETVIRESDFLSLHAPLNAETKGMINKDVFDKMKNSAFIINASRGPLIVEDDLIEALNKGRIAGAALDVISVEPMEKGSKLIGTKNLIITPHIAWAPISARTRLIDIAVDNLKSFIDGNAKNVINK